MCPPNSPRTWLGVYDHIFLENAARIIEEDKDETPIFHFIYTTSNHGPYNIPVEKYGFRRETCLPDLPDAILKDKGCLRRFACWYYTDKALIDFARAMRRLYPDSLFILTGDHAASVIPFGNGIIPRTEPTLREKFLTSFAIAHPELDRAMFANNRIGAHMNILPTLMELIAPAGFTYYSLFPSLTTPINLAIAPHCWLDNETIGDYADMIAQPLTVSADNLPTQMNERRYGEYRDAYAELTGYMVRHPELLTPVGKQANR